MAAKETKDALPIQFTLHIVKSKVRTHRFGSVPDVFVSLSGPTFEPPPWFVHRLPPGPSDLVREWVMEQVVANLFFLQRLALLLIS